MIKLAIGMFLGAALSALAADTTVPRHPIISWAGAFMLTARSPDGNADYLRTDEHGNVLAKCVEGLR